MNAHAMPPIKAASEYMMKAAVLPVQASISATLE